MKLQELSQGPKSSPSPMPRAARGAGADEKSGFAGALNEARRKPEPKPAETEAPAAKKPAPAKKNHRARKDDAAPVDDAITPDAAAVEQTESQPLQDESEPVATDGEGSEGAENSDKDAAAEDRDPNAETPALTLTAPVPTPLPVTLEEDVDAVAAELPNAIPAVPKQPAQVPQSKQNVIEANAQPADMAAAAPAAATASENAAAMVLEGFESVEDLPLAENAEPVAPPVATKPVSQANQQSSTPLAPVESAAPSNNSKREEGGQENGSNAPAEWALESEVLAGEESAATPVATTSADATVAQQTASVHAQPEVAKTQAGQPGTAAPAPAPAPPQVHFADTNHPKIVTAVQAQALTNGGLMQIRLDPPELGALQVLVHMQDGVMTASFQTSNDDATRMLSHSLSQLKQVLESSGVSVDKLQVQQAPKDQQAGNQGEDPQRQRDQHDDAHRQEQQRKDMLRRMWRRLANGSDPLDLVA